MQISPGSLELRDISSLFLVFYYLVLVARNLSNNNKNTHSLYLLQTAWHIGLKHSSFVYLILSPAVVAFLLLQGSPWLNDANANTGGRAFYITGAQQSGIMCCRVQSDEKKCTQVETAGLCLPHHSESHTLINDHRHKGTFTSQQPCESTAYIRVSGLVFFL